MLGEDLSNAVVAFSIAAGHWAVPAIPAALRGWSCATRSLQLLSQRCGACSPPSVRIGARARGFFLIGLADGSDLCEQKSALQATAQPVRRLLLVARQQGAPCQRPRPSPWPILTPTLLWLMRSRPPHHTVSPKARVLRVTAPARPAAARRFGTPARRRHGADARRAHRSSSGSWVLGACPRVSMVLQQHGNSPITLAGGRAGGWSSSKHSSERKSSASVNSRAQAMDVFCCSRRCALALAAVAVPLGQVLVLVLLCSCPAARARDAASEWACARCHGPEAS